MIKEPELLRVEMMGRQVGRLALTSKGLTAFEYDPDWLSDGFPISPFYLPLRSGVFIAKPEPFEGLFGVFNDSLPDGWGNLLLDRMLQRKGIDPDSLTSITRLSIIGSAGMGALEYLPATRIGDVTSDLTIEELANEASGILREEPSERLDQLFIRGGSSGGARPKVLLRQEDGDWIVKFRSAEDPEEVGQTEYACSLLAKQAGIDMPETRLFHGKYFGVRRFDRGAVGRIHMISAGGLLHASHRYPSLDYKDLLQATLVLTHDMEEAIKLFRQMIFNVAIGNKDDHAKNFSFLYVDNQWQLSPAYDLLPSSGFNHQHTTTIKGMGTPDKQDLLEVATQVGIKRQRALAIYDEIYSVTQTFRPL